MRSLILSRLPVPVVSCGLDRAVESAKEEGYTLEYLETVRLAEEGYEDLSYIKPVVFLKRRTGGRAILVSAENSQPPELYSVRWYNE